MKSIKVFLSLVLMFTFAIGTVSANGEKIEKKQFNGLNVLKDTTEVSYLEDGTKVTTIRKVLEGGIEDLKRLIAEEENNNTDQKILSHNKLGNDLTLDNNIGTFALPPTVEEAQSWNSNNLMLQLVGHNGKSLKILDLSWKVLANVTTYHAALPGKTVTDLTTKARLKVNSYGIVGGTEVIFEQKLYEAPNAGTTSSSYEFSASGGGAFVYVSVFIGGDFTYKYQGNPFGSTRWWNDAGYVSS